MIGSHDSMSYLKPRYWIFRPFSRLWRTQCKTIKEQYAFGIRFFDFRVRWDKGKWRFCHGICDFKLTCNNLEDICLYMKKNCPNAIYRIVLERGYTAEFRRQAMALVPIVFSLVDIPDTIGYINEYPKLWRVDIRSAKSWMGNVCNNNDSLYKRGYKFAEVHPWEYPAHELHGKVDKDNWWRINLRDEARKINGSLPFFYKKYKRVGDIILNLLKLQLENKDTLYLLDYCTNEYK